MPALNAVSGTPCPVFVAGIKYRSIFEAAIETDISVYWLTKSIGKTAGAPVVIKNQFVVTNDWVRLRTTQRITV